MVKHINPFKMMSKKQLQAGLEADIDSRFGTTSKTSKVKKSKGAGNFLHLAKSSKKKATA